MFSAGYLVIAVVDLALLIWAIKLCRQFPTPSVILATVPLTLLWFDNLTVGLGSTLGEGQPLIAMNTVRFLAHYFLLPTAFICIGSMAKQADFAIARYKAFTGSLCVLAVYLMYLDVSMFLAADFYPSCFADTLRYTTHIAAHTACGPDAEIGAGVRILPIPAISMSLAMLVLGIALWIKLGWKWLFVGTLAALPLFGVPHETTGGIVGNAGEPIITAAILITAAWLSGWRGGPAKGTATT